MELDLILAQLTGAIESIPDLGARVSALNKVRLALHDVSPFKGEPVDCVLWVPSDGVHANDYNPNSVAPPEMLLLERSIALDGYTQPIVACPLDEADGRVDVVVDGFHRHRVGKESKEVAARIMGYLPVVRLSGGRHSRKDLMASTIRHNRARGRHSIDKMTSIVGEMVMLGWKDAQICKELGMEVDEVLRLKQISGLASLFADREFSEAWEPAARGSR